MLVVDVAALAPHDHRHLVVLVEGAHPREVHPQVALGQLLQAVGVPSASATPLGPGDQGVAVELVALASAGSFTFVCLPSPALPVSRAASGTCGLDTQDNATPLDMRRSSAPLGQQVRSALYEMYKQRRLRFGRLRPLRRRRVRA